MPSILVKVSNRSQRVGVRQPETLVEKHSSVSPRVAAQMRFQVAGTTQQSNLALAPARPQSDRSDVRLPAADLNSTVSSITQPPQPIPPSRQDGITNLDAQISSPDPWGGKSILATPSSKGVISTITRELTQLVRGWGGRSTFPQPSPIDVISTVVRQPAQLIRSWGGYATVPLYWLDLTPIFEEPVGKNKWSASALTGSKWAVRPQNVQRFTLTVDGGLEWPALI